MSTQRAIPGIPGYSIDDNGTVYDKEQKVVEQKIGRKGHPTVSLMMPWWKEKHHRVARLMLMAFDPRDKIDDLSITYNDGDITNVSLDNLAWSFEWYNPTLFPGITCPPDVFVAIPGFSNYGIDIYGNVKNLETGNLIKSITRGSTDHQCVRIRDDAGEWTSMLVHRLSALTFLMHPKDTDHLVVNHKDGNPKNNNVSNLEWTTYAENNRHAFQTGLRPDKAVMSRNLETGEIKTHATLSDCARYIGVAPNYLHTYVAAKLVTKFSTVKDKYQVKSANDLTPWPAGKVVARTLLDDVGEIEVLNLNTGKVDVLPKMIEVHRKYGIPKSSVANLLLKPLPTPYGSLMIRKKSDKKWPVYPPEIIAVFNQMRNKSRPVKVTDMDTGDVTYWAGTKYWCRKHANADPAIVSRSVNHTGRFEHYRFKYINLYDYARFE